MMHFIPLALCGYGLIPVLAAVGKLPEISYLYIITDETVYNVPSVMLIGPHVWAFFLADRSNRPFFETNLNY